MQGDDSARPDQHELDPLLHTMADVNEAVAAAQTAAETAVDKAVETAQDVADAATAAAKDATDAVADAVETPEDGEPSKGICARMKGYLPSKDSVCSGMSDLKNVVLYPLCAGIMTGIGFAAGKRVGERYFYGPEGKVQ